MMIEQLESRRMMAINWMVYYNGTDTEANGDFAAVDFSWDRDPTADQDGNGCYNLEVNDLPVHNELRVIGGINMTNVTDEPTSGDQVTWGGGAITNLDLPGGNGKDRYEPHTASSFTYQICGAGLESGDLWHPGYVWLEVARTELVLNWNDDTAQEGTSNDAQFTVYRTGDWNVSDVNFTLEWAETSQATAGTDFDDDFFGSHELEAEGQDYYDYIIDAPDDALQEGETGSFVFRVSNAYILSGGVAGVGGTLFNVAIFSIWD